MYKILVNDKNRFSCSSYTTIFEWWITLIKIASIFITVIFIFLLFLSNDSNNLNYYNDMMIIIKNSFIFIMIVVLFYKCFIEVMEENLTIISSNFVDVNANVDEVNEEEKEIKIIIKKYNICKCIMNQKIINYNDLHSIIIHEYIDVISINTCLALRFRRYKEQSKSNSKQKKKKKDEKLYLIFNEIYPGIDVIKEIFRKIMIMAPPNWKK